jgi:hypothetical protein
VAFVSSNSVDDGDRGILPQWHLCTYWLRYAGFQTDFVFEQIREAQSFLSAYANVQNKVQSLAWPYERRPEMWCFSEYFEWNNASFFKNNYTQLILSYHNGRS